MTRLTSLLPLLGAVAVAAQTVSLQGCYSSAGSLQSQGTYIYQSTGYCATTCKRLSSSAIALQNSECYCGDELPPASDKVDDSKCNTSCPGYPMNTCGGDGYFSVAALSYNDTTTYLPEPTSATSSTATTGTNATHSITSGSTSSASAPSASYTGAAASACVGSGALAMGALVAFL